MEANTIDMIPAGISEVYHASQGDSGRTIRCDLVNGSAAVTLTGAENLVVHYVTSSGTVGSFSITNTFGTKSYVDVPIPSDLTSAVGRVYCKLRVEGIGAKAFYLDIEGRP